MLRDAEGRLSNRFVLTANLEAEDGGAAIVAGNQRVVRARLADAKYFWETDQKPLPDSIDKASKPLDQRLAKLEAQNIVFHAKLGTQHERILRIAALAQDLSVATGADPALAERAAMLAKADLVTEMVGEFPELQGVMGRYYAALQGEAPSVAAAIEEHYKPLGPSDRVPSDPVSITVALADKLDTLVGFWAIEEKPTGSKDPFALRRAALGVIRLLVENRMRLALTAVIERHFAVLGQPGRKGMVDDLLSFFAERLKVLLRDKGARHDLVDAVFALPGQDDLMMITRRVEALGTFLDSENGRNLLAGYRRAANILRIEERKDAASYDAEPDASLIEARGLPEERVLAHVLDAASHHAREHVLKEEFTEAMAALAELRPAVDAFFDKVTVNDPDPALRANRLKLLSGLRRAVHEVADFSRIEG